MLWKYKKKLNVKCEIKSKLTNANNFQKQNMRNNRNIEE